MFPARWANFGWGTSTQSLDLLWEPRHSAECNHVTLMKVLHCLRQTLGDLLNVCTILLQITQTHRPGPERPHIQWSRQRRFSTDVVFGSLREWSPCFFDFVSDQLQICEGHIYVSLIRIEFHRHPTVCIRKQMSHNSTQHHSFLFLIVISNQSNEFYRVRGLSTDRPSYWQLWSPSIAKSSQRTSCLTSSVSQKSPAGLICLQHTCGSRHRERSFCQKLLASCVPCMDLSMRTTQPLDFMESSLRSSTNSCLLQEWHNVDMILPLNSHGSVNHKSVWISLMTWIAVWSKNMCQWSCNVPRVISELSMDVVRSHTSEFGRPCPVCNDVVVSHKQNKVSCTSFRNRFLIDDSNRDKLSRILFVSFVIMKFLQILRQRLWGLEVLLVPFQWSSTFVNLMIYQNSVEFSSFFTQVKDDLHTIVHEHIPNCLMHGKII